MRRYKIVACILLILSVFSSVLAAPIKAEEVREARADTLDASDNGSRKRAKEGDPLLAQSQQEASSSNLRWTPPQSQELTSALGYVSGANPKPSISSGESKPPLLSTSGGTEPSWYPGGKAGLIEPGTSIDIQPAPLPSKAKSVSFSPWKEVKSQSGVIKNVALVPGQKLKRPALRGTYGYTRKKVPQSLALPPKPQSMSIFGNLVAVAKLLFSKVASKLKFWR